MDDNSSQCPFQWYLPYELCHLKIRLASSPKTRRSEQKSWPLRSSFHSCSWRHSNHRWNHCLILTWRSHAWCKLLPSWRWKLEDPHMDPFLPPDSLSKDLFRSSSSGTCEQQFWHEVCVPARLQASQSGIVLCGQFAVTDQLLHSWERWSSREQSQFYLRFCQRRTVLLLKCLCNVGGTWICASDDSAVVLDGHDRGAHVFDWVEEALMILLLLRDGAVHLSFLKIIQMPII